MSEYISPRQKKEARFRHSARKCAFLHAILIILFVMKLDFRPILIVFNMNQQTWSLFDAHTSAKGNADFFFSETGESEHIIEPTICMFVMCEEHLQIV